MAGPLLTDGLGARHNSQRLIVGAGGLRWRGLSSKERKYEAERSGLLASFAIRSPTVMPWLNGLALDVRVWARWPIICGEMPRGNVQEARRILI